MGKATEVALAVPAVKNKIYMTCVVPDKLQQLHQLDPSLISQADREVLPTSPSSEVVHGPLGVRYLINRTFAPLFVDVGDDFDFVTKFQF